MKVGHTSEVGFCERQGWKFKHGQVRKGRRCCAKVFGLYLMSHYRGEMVMARSYLCFRWLTPMSVKRPDGGDKARPVSHLALKPIYSPGKS